MRLVVDGAGAGHDAMRRLHRDAVRAAGRAAPVPLPQYHTICMIVSPIASKTVDDFVFYTDRF